MQLDLSCACDTHVRERLKPFAVTKLSPKTVENEQKRDKQGKRNFALSDSCSSAENDVSGILARLVFDYVIAECRKINPGEHGFALPERDGGQGEMQFVD